jgi:hypothetical protein
MLRYRRDKPNVRHQHLSELSLESGLRRERPLLIIGDANNTKIIGRLKHANN